jgi:mannose-6-phosphate isomerase-like protein (cupin superfamily)
VGVKENSVALEQAVIECEPQGSISRATGEAEEVLFVIAGSGALFAGSERHALEPETGAYVAPGRAYELRNEASDPMRVVCVRIRDPAPETEADEGQTAIVVRRLADQEAQAATTERSFRIVAEPTTAQPSATPVGGARPARPPDHFHTYDEVIYVLDGTGTFSAGEDIRPIGPGSQIELPPRTIHCLENTGHDVMRLVAVFRPAGSPAHAYLPDGSPAYPGTPPLFGKSAAPDGGALGS